MYKNVQNRTNFIRKPTVSYDFLQFPMISCGFLQFPTFISTLVYLL